MFLNNNVTQRSVSSLLLDSENPRLIGILEDAELKTQKKILLSLTLNYDVIDICQSIMANGYYPEFNIVTIPKDAEGSKLVVVEGNRRTSACKIILNPDLLKGTKYNYYISRIKKNPNYEIIKESLKKINVVILDNRNDAETYKALKHTRQSIKSWSPYTQGGYFVSKLVDDMMLSDVREQLNLSDMKLSQIQRVVFFYRLGSVILNLKCWSVDERAFFQRNKDDLKVEAIIRLVQSKYFSDEVGAVKIDGYGNLIHQGLSVSKFEFVMEKLARDSHFADEKKKGEFVLSTRQEDKSAIKEYINGIKKELLSVIDVNHPQDSKERGTDDLDSDNYSEVEAIDEPTIIRGRKGRKWTRLLPIDMPFPTKIPKLKSLADEATKLDVKKHPNTSALLSRAIFEITLKVWIKENKLEAMLKSEYKSNAFDFSNLLKFAGSNMKLLITDDADSMKAVGQVIANLLTVNKDILNLTNHNDVHDLSESEVLHIRDKLTTFCRYFFPRLTAGQ